jgi:hypothetical protein
LTISHLHLPLEHWGLAWLRRLTRLRRLVVSDPTELAVTEAGILGLMTLKDLECASFTPDFDRKFRRALLQVQDHLPNLCEL